jgi:hypothetical protein
MSIARGIAAALRAEVDRNVPRIYPHTSDIGDAVETMNAGAGWPCGVDVSPAVAVECWRLVQYVKELPGALDERFRVS